MLKFVELCVDLRKGRTAKEGLHLYKNVTQNTSVVSVETVINVFIKRSKDKLQEALAKVDEIEGPANADADSATASDPDARPQPNGEVSEVKDGEEMQAPAIEAQPTATQSKATVPAEVEDLEASETPESILLSAVSEEKSRDRTYRTVVMPWLRFLWEAYRTSLDILRNNARLENLYQQVAHEAFDFCLLHQRKTEFRRLCETLRSHLSSSQKYAHQAHSINLSDPETLQRHLDTRFHQLNTAVDLELWQEAFRTAEDIHGLVGLSKRVPKASMMATYFEKLVKIFAVGNNFLFHAAAYGRYHSLQTASKGEEADNKAASLALLSALAVPIVSDAQARRRDGSAHVDSESARGKAARLASLLGLNATPTRSELLQDVVCIFQHALKQSIEFCDDLQMRRDVLNNVPENLRDLYTILEVDFHPLLITRKIDPILGTLSQDPEMARYVEPLKEVVLSRLLNQLSQVYDSLRLDKAIKLATFSSEADDLPKARARIERFIAGACRRGDLDVTFDHAGASIVFDQDLFGSVAATAADLTLPIGTDNKSILQSSPALLLRSELANVAQALYQAVCLMQTKNNEYSPVVQAQEAREAAMAHMAAQLKAERKALLARKGVIEKRKKEADELSARREKEEAANRAMRIQAKAEELARKEKEDALRRQTELVRKQAEEMKKKEQKELAQQLLDKRGIKLNMAANNITGESDVIKLTVEAIEKEKRETAEKIRVVGKRMDHLERAFRQEEQALLEQDYHRQQARDRRTFERTQQQTLDELRSRHQSDLAVKKRLQSLLPDYFSFREEKEAQAIARNAELERQSQQNILTEKKKLREQLRAKREAKMQADAQAERDRVAREERERKEQEGEADVRLHVPISLSKRCTQNEQPPKPNAQLKKKLSVRQPKKSARPKKPKKKRSALSFAPSAKKASANWTSKPRSRERAKKRWKPGKRREGWARQVLLLPFRDPPHGVGPELTSPPKLPTGQRVQLRLHRGLPSMFPASDRPEPHQVCL